MFSKILVANRGEIACRIIKTAKRLGLATAAVYSDADKDAMHAALADEAIWIGPSPARESYLDCRKILQAARLCGAEAIHPGYGFLAENADFAENCAAAGLAFVGPPAPAIRAMGDKAQAKGLMERTGVPLVPGYHGEAQDEAALAQAAIGVGYPVMIKPSAGGGGKGMKIAEGAADFFDKLGSAKREALSAFGDDRIVLEKYLARPRHVEVQIFADGAGNCVHLFDRDCSAQRRHQKIIEEAPAPAVPDELRRAMHEAAISAARAVGYIGAGTVEFLFSPEDAAFYFLEMNTRLQVEHPVTEMITGIDLVAWQFEIAAGGALPLRQDEIAYRGHSVEARLYAEDPARGFLPQAGRLLHLTFPEPRPEIRADSGYKAGDTIPLDYDPLIAKLVVWGKDRQEALQSLGKALGELRLAGLRSNLELLLALTAHGPFRAAPQDTGFVERCLESLLTQRKAAEPIVVALAVLGLLCERQNAAAEMARQSPDPFSPWHKRSGFRLNGEARESLRLYETAAGSEHEIAVTYLRQGFHLAFEDNIFPQAAGALRPEGGLEADFEGHRCKAVWLRYGRQMFVFFGPGEPYLFEVAASRAAGVRAREGAAGGLAAPMPGRVAALLVAPGDVVAANQPLLVLEAMKMEHMLRAPRNGIVKKFNFAAGDQVPEGAELATFEAEDT